MKERFWEIMGYVVLGLFIVGQITIGFNFFLGQACYFVGDIICTIRCFAIKQERADKVKNVVLTAICIGTTIVKLITG